MARTPIADGGWFDIDRATRFDESTHFDGSNRISDATGSQWEHEYLYYSRAGAWILNRTSQWQGTTDTYRKIGESDAAGWLVHNGITDLEQLPMGVRDRVEALIAELEV